jgi:integrase/recombinase XerC/integrase/recombinase XerD
MKGIANMKQSLILSPPEKYTCQFCEKWKRYKPYKGTISNWGVCKVQNVPQYMYAMVIGKGRRGRIVPLGKTMRQALRDYLNVRKPAAVSSENKYIFLTWERRPIKNSTLDQLMKRLKKKTGIRRLHAHLFRHTFATNYLIHGLGDVYELSRLLGHSDIKTTEWYLQLASYYTIMERRERVTYLDKIKGSKINRLPR